MSRIVEAAHDLEQCPICRTEIDAKALVCAACGAERTMINDGKGDRSETLAA